MIVRPRSRPIARGTCRPRRRRSLGAAWLATTVAAVALVGCASTPSGPCLDDAASQATISFERLSVMSWESDGSTELVRFQFDPSAPGRTTVTVEPAEDGPFLTAAFQEPVEPAGDVLTSIRLDGLAAIGQVEQLAAAEGDGFRIREIVPVVDPADLRVIVGTATGRCLRLAVDDGNARISLLVTDG